MIAVIWPGRRIRVTWGPPSAFMEGTWVWHLFLNRVGFRILGLSVIDRKRNQDANLHRR